jgi:hypothetical protein
MRGYGMEADLWSVGVILHLVYATCPHIPCHDGLVLDVAPACGLLGSRWRASTVKDCSELCVCVCGCAALLVPTSTRGAG